MRKVLLAAAFAAFCLPSPATAHAARADAGPWVAMTKADLKAVHDAIAANHPGAVDPQNPGFKDWLEKGYAKALAVADQAKSFEDYQRVLRLYKTGFRDGHVGIVFHLNPDTLSWPGFVLYGTKATNIQVVAAEPGAGVTVGDRLLGCDGQDVDALLAAHTDAYYWNADIPHLRYGAINRMFQRPQGWSITQPELDTRQQIKTCQFSSGTVTLKWRGGNYADVLAKYDAALATPQEPKCLVPCFSGKLLSFAWKEALWDKFYTAAPQRQRRCVERYKIVKRA